MSKAEDEELNGKKKENPAIYSKQSYKNFMTVSYCKDEGGRKRFPGPYL